MIQICKIPDHFRWSFSKLEAFEHCPEMFRLTYIDKAEQTNNGFAEFGTLCHSVLEHYATEETPIFALAEEYAERYDAEVTAPFPPFPHGMAQKYYEQGLQYFEEFEGFGDQYDVREVETKFELDIEGRTFVGIVDLILQDRETGEFTVIDHKSKSMSTMKKDLPTYRKQLYLYAAYVKQKYGVFPTTLKFNIFRENDWVTIDFDEAEYLQTMQWVLDTIKAIESNPIWTVSTSSFFCRFVCGVFDACPARDSILTASSKKKKEAKKDG